MSVGLAARLRYRGKRVVRIREENDGEETEEYYHSSYPDVQPYDGAIASLNNEHMAPLVHHTTNANVLTPAAIYSPSLFTTQCRYFTAVCFIRCAMAITLLELSSARPSNFNTDARTKARKDETRGGREAVQYRQLISRAVTQRLHSPSLDDLTNTKAGDTTVHFLEEWELQERCIARNKARVEAEKLGIPWSKTAHVLACTRSPHSMCITRSDS